MGLVEARYLLLRAFVVSCVTFAAENLALVFDSILTPLPDNTTLKNRQKLFESSAEICYGVVEK